MQRQWNALITGTIESVKIESDERGFELHLTDDDGTRYVLNVHAVAARLLKATQDEIGAWLEEGRRLADEHERELCRHGYPEGCPDCDAPAHLPTVLKDGYELSDPKHPTYHERMTS